jgi:hypothetical protein
MKSLRALVLMLAIAAVSFNATQAFSQQEVDPDHYDQPVAAKPAAKAPVNKVSTGNHARGHKNLASKRSRQRHSHVAA